MVSLKEYAKHPESFWKGKKVVTLVPMRNGWYDVPSGTTLVIKRKYCGFACLCMESVEWNWKIAFWVLFVDCLINSWKSD